ncbi:MAG: hypothetical protein MI919_12615, partial [Holophagales bacterium]|nr:hypothetical protein [Holophagales bacterium]
MVAVLAAYMAGLAAGARLAGRLVERVGRPVRLYALLEVGIALSALSVPAWIALAGRLQVLLLGGGDLPRDGASIASTLFYLVASFAVLFLPTGLMGATLPLLARHAVRREGQIGSRIALLYGMNTVGAAAGALASAFLLLPALGLGHTIWIAAALNLLVAALAAGFLRDRVPVPITSVAEAGTGAAGPSAAAPGARPAAGWILPAIALSGVVSFSWEVVWTRLLGQFLGGSIYAFAVVLASFLVALGLGSLLAIPWVRTREQARLGFVVAQIAIAGLSILAFLAADRLPLVAGSGPDRVWAPWLAAAVIFPGALAIGLTFPCAVRIAARDAHGTPEASARVFAWNTAGAILGALATGYLALPRLHFAGTVAAAAITSLVLALVAASVRRPRRPVLAGIAGIGVATLVLAPPAAPWGLLRYSPMAEAAVPGKVEYFGVGRGATVLLTEQHGEWRLLTNGLPESSIESPAHRASRYLVARWLSLLPLAARPEARSLLVVGLGAGVTVENVPPSIETVDVIELEPEVVRANRRVADRRRRDPLADPRLRLHLLDARGALRLTGQRFDAVVSQPSHPWTTGASHLYTREFFS